MISTSPSILKEAWEHYHAAEHLLKVTYPLLKDPKLLLGIITTIYNTLSTALNYFLESHYDDQLIQKFHLLQQKKIHLPKESENLIHSINNLKMQHQQSPIEFSRKNKMVICTREYHLQTISQENIKELLQKTKETLNYLESRI